MSGTGPCPERLGNITDALRPCLGCEEADSCLEIADQRAEITGLPGKPRPFAPLSGKSTTTPPDASKPSFILPAL